MDGLSILAGLTAFNNRATEAFKMVLRDKTPLDDEWRHVATLLFSVFLGIGSVAASMFSGVSFNGTWLDPFSANAWVVAVVGGASVSIVSGIIQPLIDRLSERGDSTVTFTEESSLAVTQGSGEGTLTVTQGADQTGVIAAQSAAAIKS